MERPTDGAGGARFIVDAHGHVRDLRPPAKRCVHTPEVSRLEAPQLPRDERVVEIVRAVLTTIVFIGIVWAAVTLVDFWWR